MLIFTEAREKLERTTKQTKKNSRTVVGKTKLWLAKEWKNRIDVSLYAPNLIIRLYRSISFVL